MTQNSDRRPSEGGFTLLELLVVLAILGMLATIAAPRVTKYLSGAKSGTAEVEISALAQTLELYRLENGTLPSQEAGLNALIERPANRPKWNGPYLDRETSLNDPWGVPYHYNIPGDGREYNLFTLGADNKPGGTGENADIRYR